MTELASIHEAMAAVLNDLPAIGKNQRNQQQGYQFRGIDDVIDALNPLLAKHGVFFVPDVIERIESARQTRNGGTMWVVNLHVRYTFYGPRGDYVMATAWGEGTDSGDKATQKAMTGAMKYVLFQVFAIATHEQAEADSDRTIPAPSARRQSARSAEAGSDSVGRASEPELVSAHRSTDAVDEMPDSSTGRTGARLTEPPVAGPAASVPVPVPPTPGATAGSESSLSALQDSDPDSWKISPIELHDARARIVDLQARGVKFQVERRRRGGLPPMDENIAEHEYHAWLLMLDALDAETPAKALL